MPDSQELDTQKTDTQEQEADRASASYDAEVYGVLKCYFFTPKRGDVWGAFCFMFNGGTGESMDNVFWVTRELTGPAIDVDAHWRSLNKMIPQMGSYEKTIGDKLSVLMLESFPVGTRVELCQSANTSELLQALAGETRKNFERSLHCFLEFRMAFERVSKQDMANSGILTKEEAQAEPSADSSQTEEKSFAGTFITCLPVIDPVHGRAVSDLEPGDMVEVKLQGGVGASELIYKFLQSSNQDAIFPIERVEKTDADKTYVILKINEEVSGIITVTKDLRLRTLNPGGRKKVSVTFNMDNVVFFGVLAAAAVIIALVVRFLLS